MSKTRIVFAWVLPCAIAASLATSLYWGSVLQAHPKSDQESLDRIKMLHDLVQEVYVNDVPSEKIYEGAAKGMLSALDPFSEYFSPDEYKELQIDTTGEFGGLGIEISIEDTWLTVVTPIEDTPAFRAGIQAGDRVTEIDGETTEGFTTTMAVKKLRGKPGTKVTLTVYHKAGMAPEKIDITRDIIKLKSVKGAKFVDADKTIGYIRVTAFQEDTTASFEKAARDLIAQGAKGLIVDLRFNGGGLLDEAIGLVDLFLADGVIVSTRGRLEKENKVFRAKKDGTLPDLPLAVLVNDSSASASEIFSGAIRDHHRGVLVGSRTYGKGSVQTIIPLDDDQAAVKLTTAKYYTPSGECIHHEKGAKKWGIEPDIKIELTPQQMADLQKHRANEDVIVNPGDKPEPDKFEDIQQSRAIDLLKALIALNGKK